MIVYRQYVRLQSRDREIGQIIDQSETSQQYVHLAAVRRTVVGTVETYCPGRLGHGLTAPSIEKLLARYKALRFSIPF